MKTKLVLLLPLFPHEDPALSKARLCALAEAEKVLEHSTVVSGLPEVPLSDHLYFSDDLARLGRDCRSVVRLLTRLAARNNAVFIPGQIDTRKSSPHREALLSLLKALSTVSETHRRSKIKAAFQLRRLQKRPNGRSPVAEEIRQQIIEADPKLSVRSLARQLGVSKSLVSQVRKKTRVVA